MKRFLSTATVALVLAAATYAHALCGDVTGDNQRSASDALAVLRSAVGQQVDLVCEGDGPPQLRLLNPFFCGGESATSEARFNGLTFQAESEQFSEYQTVDREQIDTIEIDACGGTFGFDGPINLPPGRRMTFFFALLDPAVYQIPEVDTPAQFLIYDDGVEPEMTAGTTPANAMAAYYGGIRR